MWFSGLRTQLLSMKMRVQSLAFLSWLRTGVAVSCSLGHRCGLDLLVLWLEHGQAATALIQRLAWELPYAAGTELKRQKKKKKKKIVLLYCNEDVTHDVRDCFFLVFSKIYALLTT